MWTRTGREQREHSSIQAGNSVLGLSTDLHRLDLNIDLLGDLKTAVFLFWLLGLIMHNKLVPLLPQLV